MIRIGQWREEQRRKESVILCEDAELKPHLNTPWFRDFVERQVGEPLLVSASLQQGEVEISDLEFARHALLCGATGSGKSRLMEHLVAEHIRQGCSVLLIDPKAELTEKILAHAVANNIPPENILVLDPESAESVPGWNPFLSRASLQKAVSDFVSMLEQSTTSWGPRLGDLLTNALFVIGTHQLSLVEMVKLLQNDRYRTALLATPLHGSESLAYRQARAYFKDEFDVWARSERTQAISPVLNKVRELLHSPFLCALLCAQKNTLHLERLWAEQRVVLVNLNRAVLGEESTRLLAGLLTNTLFRTAMRTTGTVPVVLALDELASMERFVGHAINDIVTVGRSRGLRGILACQHLEQLSPELRTTLLSNVAVKAFFRLGHADARIVASALAVNSGSHISRVKMKMETATKNKPELTTTWKSPILNAEGRELQVRKTQWLQSYGDKLSKPYGMLTLRRLASLCGSPRLYVKPRSGSNHITLEKALEGAKPESMHFEFGPPLQICVTFPRPNISGVDRQSEADVVRSWTKTIQELPVQHAVMWVSGMEAGVAKIAHVSECVAPTAEILRRSQLHNGQGSLDVMLDARELAMENLVNPPVPTLPETGEIATDGSLI